MNISRKLAIKILKYLDQHKNFYFPFLVMNREYLSKDIVWVEIEPSNWEKIKNDKKHKTFQLWENLQNIDESTIKLMAKGFLEKINHKTLESQIKKLAHNYRKEWKEELWESEKIEEYGLNEFIGGKADGYEECLKIIRNINN